MGKRLSPEERKRRAEAEIAEAEREEKLDAARGLLNEALSWLKVDDCEGAAISAEHAAKQLRELAQKPEGGQS